MIILLIICVVLLILWIAYSLSAAYQQTLTISIPFDETYRYTPALNRDHKFRLDSIKITITGTIKKDATGAVISPGARVREVIQQHIIDPYRNCVLAHETDIFTLSQDDLTHIPMRKNPTLENLSVLFFSKLAPLMPSIGCQLVSVKVTSENLSVTHSRYKISDYSL